MSAPETRWSWRLGIESGVIDVESDRISEGGPLVVTIEMSYHDGTDDHTALAILAPALARGLAKAILREADVMEHFEGRHVE